MPKYTVKDPVSGKTIVLTGDSPPTEAELTEIFAHVQGETNKPPAAATGPTPAAGRGTGYSPHASMSEALQALVDFLPLAGGTVGGAIGGAGGTVLGAGVGGVPGAMGGAALGGAAGEATRQLLNRALGKATPDTSSGAATDIAAQAGIQGVSEGAGQLLTKGAGLVGKAVYRGYLKPSLRGTAIKQAREIVETGLREGLPVTKAGEERATRLIDEINTDVNSMLAKNKGTVDLHQVADRVRAFAKQKYYKPGVDPSDYKAALDVADSLDQHASLGLPAGATTTRVDVSAVNANDVKQAVRPNSRAYGQQGAAPEAATRKQAGHEMRTAIEALDPAVGPKNDRERQLIDALEAITRGSGREENRSALTGVPSMVSGAVFGEESARTGNPTTALVKSLALRAALSPAVATRLAIAASRFAKVPGTAPAIAVRLAIQSVMSGAQEQGQEPVAK